MTGATTDAGREQPDTPTETALDAIAALCGCPEWHYPGQLVRDVAALLAERDAAQDEVERLRTMNADLIENMGRQHGKLRALSAALRNHHADCARDTTGQCVVCGIVETRGGS